MKTKSVPKVTRNRWANRIVGQGLADPKTLAKNALNWRKHPASQLQAMRAVLNNLGWIQDVIVNHRSAVSWGAERNQASLIDGHLRVEIAIADKEKTVPVKYVDLEPEEERLALASFDPLSAMAATDGAKLNEVLAGIEVEDEALKALYSKLQREADEAVKKAGLSTERDHNNWEDAADELQVKWGTKRGQIWKLGRHRLMCGDSMNPKDVERLLGKARIDGICTDPPFELSAAQTTRALNLFGDAVILLAGDRLAFELVRFWHFRHCFIWKHRTPSSGPNFNMPVLYHTQVLNLVRTENVRSDWRRPQKNWGSIVEIEREGEVESEAAQKRRYGWGKSAQVFVEMLRGFPWKKIADPFAGSGATFIACEMLGRECRGMELTPRGAAVALERWTEYCPSDPPQKL